MIADAREMAARGEARYRDALDSVARDAGYDGWAGAQAVAGDGPADGHPRGPVGAVRDMAASIALLCGSHDGPRRRDRAVTGALRCVWRPIGDYTGIGPSAAARAAVVLATGATLAWTVLTVAIATTRHPLGSYADETMSVLPLVLAMDGWLATRWLLCNRDPLRPVCRGVRVNALNLLAFRTVFASIPWTWVSGTDLVAPVIAHVVALALAGPAWLAAMHADVLAAEVRHDG